MQDLTAIHEQLRSDICDRLNKIFETVQEITAPEDDEDQDGLYVLGWDTEEGALIEEVYKKGGDIVVKTDKSPFPYYLTSLPTDDKLTVLEFCEAYKNTLLSTSQTTSA